VTWNPAASYICKQRAVIHVAVAAAGPCGSPGVAGVARNATYYNLAAGAGSELQRVPVPSPLQTRCSSYLVCLAEDGFHHGDDVGGGGEVDEAQHALQLLQAHHRRRAGHEPHDRRVRQQVHDEAQPRTTF
jgi:hypothetical protein